MGQKETKIEKTKRKMLKKDQHEVSKVMEKDQICWHQGLDDKRAKVCRLETDHTGSGQARKRQCHHPSCMCTI